MTLYVNIQYKRLSNKPSPTQLHHSWEGTAETALKVSMHIQIYYDVNTE